MSTEVSEARPVVCVLGMPSGGTSTVSGVLARLGVDMGQVGYERLGKSTRLYERWEDRRLADLCAGRGITMDAFVEYVRMRREEGPRLHREPWGPRRSWSRANPVGFKYPDILVLGRYPSPAIHAMFDGLRIVHVRRPFRAVVASNYRYRGQSEQVLGRLRCYANALCRIVEHCPPVATIDYDRIVEDTGPCVRELVHRLGLVCSDTMLEEAIGSVNPRKRHVIDDADLHVPGLEDGEDPGVGDAHVAGRATG